MTSTRTPKLSPEQRRAFAQAICDELNATHPHLHFSPHDPERGTPPGARTIPLVFPASDERET